MSRIIKLFVGAVILAGIAFGGYTWLQGREPAGNGLETVAVEIGAITEKAVAVGQIEPRLKFHVKSKMSGIVRNCSVEVGDRVEAGDPLFEIVPDPTPSELVEAESAVLLEYLPEDRALGDHVLGIWHRVEFRAGRSHDLLGESVHHLLNGSLFVGQLYFVFDASHGLLLG